MYTGVISQQRTLILQICRLRRVYENAATTSLNRVFTAYPFFTYASFKPNINIKNLAPDCVISV